MTDREAYREDYPVPLYRQIICEACKLILDAHKYSKCPKCDGPLRPTSLLRRMEI